MLLWGGKKQHQSTRGTPRIPRGGDGGVVSEGGRESGNIVEEDVTRSTREGNKKIPVEDKDSHLDGTRRMGDLPAR